MREVARAELFRIVYLIAALFFLLAILYYFRFIRNKKNRVKRDQEKEENSFLFMAFKIMNYGLLLIYFIFDAASILTLIFEAVVLKRNLFVDFSPVFHLLFSVIAIYPLFILSLVYFRKRDQRFILTYILFRLMSLVYTIVDYSGERLEKLSWYTFYGILCYIVCNMLWTVYLYLSQEVRGYINWNDSVLPMEEMLSEKRARSVSDQKEKTSFGKKLKLFPKRPRKAKTAEKQKPFRKQERMSAASAVNTKTEKKQKAEPQKRPSAERAALPKQQKKERAIPQKTIVLPMRKGRSKKVFRIDEEEYDVQEEIFDLTKWETKDLEKKLKE